MQTTMILPSGNKLRTQTQRRYVLAWDGPTRPEIVRRSDNLQTLRKLTASIVQTRHVVIDTVERRVLFDGRQGGWS